MGSDSIFALSATRVVRLRKSSLTPFSAHVRVCSSAGQSTRLISVGSLVQIQPDPPRTIVGGVAQLGERLLCKQEVIGSIPFTSTIL
jgi:hypothetical protein